MQDWAGAEFIGGAAGILTTVSFVPQVVKVVRERDTRAISLRMYVAFTLGVALWCVYGIMTARISIIVANVVTLALASTVLAMKLRLDYGVLAGRERPRSERP